MDKYLVEGTRNQAGAIGLPDEFSEEIEAPSSRDAYITILEKPGFEHVHVIAIKMKCPECAGYHLVVPTLLYLGV